MAEIGVILHVYALILLSFIVFSLILMNCKIISFCILLS